MAVSRPGRRSDPRSRFTILIGATIGIFAIVNFVVSNQLVRRNEPPSPTADAKSKEAFLNERKRKLDSFLDTITHAPYPPPSPQVIFGHDLMVTERRVFAAPEEEKQETKQTEKPNTPPPSRRLTPITSPRSTRTLPHTGSQILLADFLYNSTNGTFWLPRPPHPQNIIRGYDVRPSTSNFAKDEYSNKKYNNEEGFMLDTHVRVMLSYGFNAGDFYCIFIAPIIAGRPASFRDDTQGNRNAISVVGSILGWGIRYVWGPGLMFGNKTYEKEFGVATTEAVFAVRGPHSYEYLAGIAPKGMVMHKTYGDPGSLLSWYYQPHDVKKKYELCVLPHHLDWDFKIDFLTKMNEWWDGPEPFRIDIMQPLFNIADEIVQCEFILSSSLHGIIFSDSYGVPNAHMKYKSNVMGEHFKFIDYYDAVGRKHEWLDMADQSLWKSGGVKKFVNEQKKKYDISKMDLFPFWESCPMHAEGYNRTREQHVEFAEVFIKEFSDLLANRPRNFTMFHKEISRRLGVSIDG